MKTPAQALVIAVLGLAALAPVQAASSAASAPSSRQLSALCDGCAIVTATHVEKREGKASAVGTAGGAVVGGVVGNKVGDGSVLGTGVGALAGAVIGREVEKRAKRHTVWIATVTRRDGQQQRYESDSDPGLKVGDTVRVDGGKLVKLAR